MPPKGFPDAWFIGRGTAPKCQIVRGRSGRPSAPRKLIRRWGENEIGIEIEIGIGIRIVTEIDELEAVPKAHWGIAEGTAAPDGENSRRGAEAQRGEWGGLLAGLR